MCVDEVYGWDRAGSSASSLAVRTGRIVAAAEEQDGLEEAGVAQNDRVESSEYGPDGELENSTLQAQLPLPIIYIMT